MQKENAVLRHLNAFGSNACRAAVITAMVTSMAPTTAIAATMTKTGTEATNNAPVSIQSEEANLLSTDSSSQNASSGTSYDLAKIADGTYTGTASVADNGDAENEDEFAGYDVSVKVSVSGHKITAVTVSQDGVPSESASYIKKAINGTKKTTGVPAQIVDAQSTDVDVVSNATYSSNAIKAAVDNALQAAYDKQNTSTPATDEYTYGYAALTWAEYWANEGVQNAGSTASSEELDSRGETDKGAFDVVTRATTNHGVARGSFQCTSVFYTTDGLTIPVSHWTDSTTFVCPDGTTGTYAKGAITYNGSDHKMSKYQLTGLRYVPVKVKTSELEAFKKNHEFVSNGETLYIGQPGSTAEGNVHPYTAIANVDANTNGLKTVTMSGDTASFSAAAVGTDSGIKDADLKTANFTPTVKANTEKQAGAFGEFLRVDFTGNGYGDLGANMQSVTWTYYGSDSTRSNAQATFGTKFAADNWMHSKMGIQLGLTESERCKLPEGTDGTGYWSLTIHALGYQDFTVNFEATSDNIVKPVPADDASLKSLQDLADKANALKQGNYTAESWDSFSLELAETNEMLAKDKSELTKAAVLTQVEHLTDAMGSLVRTAPEAGSYVLMNIPSSEFYKAETANNDTAVDVFTSATKSKTRTGSLAGGSYHEGNSGEKINGITFPVKVSEEAADAIDWSKLTQVTDDSSVTVTTTNRGQENTIEYKGKDALFEVSENADHAFYQLSGDAPANYKELTVDGEGNFVFSSVEGADATTVDDADAEFLTKSSYGDYQLNLSSNLTAEGGALANATVYGVVLNTTDGTGYGLRHLENIWRTTELAWCSTDLVPSVHNCPTSSEHYASIMGKTLKSATYYTSNGTVEVTFGTDGIYVPVKASKSEIDVEASAKADAETAEVKATLPADFKVEYTLDGADATVDNGTFSIKDLKPGKHALVAHDASGKYADVTSEFTVTTDKTVAKFDENATKITAAHEGDDVENFLKNITTVNVNGTDYAASGRGSVTIINKDGSINLDAVAGGQQGGKPKAGGQQQGTKVFANYGTYSIKVTSTGYNKPLEFTFTHKADRTDLDNAIDAAEKLDQTAFTASSWNAMSDALNAAKTVQANDAATDDDIAQALNALNSAVANLSAKATDEAKSALADLIESAGSVKNDGYTDASWNDFQTALDEAKQVASSEDPSASEAASAVDKLKAAQDALTKKGTEEKPADNNGNGSTSTTTTTTTIDTKKADASKKDASALPGTGDTQIATVGIFAGIGAAIAAAGVAIRRRMQH